MALENASPLRSVATTTLCSTHIHVLVFGPSPAVVKLDRISFYFDNCNCRNDTGSFGVEVDGSVWVGPSSCEWVLVDAGAAENCVAVAMKAGLLLDCCASIVSMPCINCTKKTSPTVFNFTLQTSTKIWPISFVIQNRSCMFSCSSLTQIPIIWVKMLD